MYRMRIKKISTYSFNNTIASVFIHGKVYGFIRFNNFDKSLYPRKIIISINKYIEKIYNDY